MKNLLSVIMVVMLSICFATSVYAGNSKKTGRKKDNNFYEIIINTGKQYDSGGGYKFICTVISRVRHHKSFWPDSNRWARHQLTVTYGFSGEDRSESISNSFGGNECKVSFPALGKTPVFIQAVGSAQDKKGNTFNLTFKRTF